MHGHRRPVGRAVVVHRERPADQGRDAEDGKVVAAHETATWVLGLAGGRALRGRGPA